MSTLYIRQCHRVQSFENGDEKKPLNWVYQFMGQCKLFVHTQTCMITITMDSMLLAKRDYRKSIMNSFNNRFNISKFLINMDGMAGFLNSSPKYTVRPGRVLTEPIGVVVCSLMCFRFVVTAKMNRTRLSLFTIFTKNKVKSVAYFLQTNISAGEIGCVPANDWMAYSNMRVWHEKGILPYVETHNGDAGLLFDDFEILKPDSLQKW